MLRFFTCQQNYSAGIQKAYQQKRALFPLFVCIIILSFCFYPIVYSLRKSQWGKCLDHILGFFSFSQKLLSTLDSTHRMPNGKFTCIAFTLNFFLQNFMDLRKIINWFLYSLLKLSDFFRKRNSQLLIFLRSIDTTDCVNFFCLRGYAQVFLQKR